MPGLESLINGLTGRIIARQNMVGASDKNIGCKRRLLDAVHRYRFKVYTDPLAIKIHERTRGRLAPHRKVGADHIPATVQV